MAFGPGFHMEGDRFCHVLVARGYCCQKGGAVAKVEVILIRHNQIKTKT